MPSSATTLPFTSQSTNTPSSVTPVSKGDRWIWGIYIALVVISIIELYSASSREVIKAGWGVYGTILRHGATLLLGFGVLVATQRCHYRMILRATPWFALFAVAGTIYAMLFGSTINSANRSFVILGIMIQPSEFLKLAAAMLVAHIMAKCQLAKGGVSNSGVVWAAAFILLFSALLIKNGTTNTLILMALSLAMMVIGGVQWRKMLLVLGVYMAVAGAYYGYHIAREKISANIENASTTTAESENRVSTVMNRLTSFNDTLPRYKQQITSDNRQEMLSYLAQAHGGITGVGPGNSRETARLPLAFTDYIYAIIVEEWGLIGGIVVLGLYLALLRRASSIASRCHRAFPALLVIGAALTIVLQALCHICIVTGVGPVSGQPLPLISKGGSSILVTSFAFGIMLSVSRYAATNSSRRSEVKAEVDSLPEDMTAQNPSMLN